MTSRPVSEFLINARRLRHLADDNNNLGMTRDLIGGTANFRASGAPGSDHSRG